MIAHDVSPMAMFKIFCLFLRILSESDDQMYQDIKFILKRLQAVMVTLILSSSFAFPQILSSSLPIPTSYINFKSSNKYLQIYQQLLVPTKNYKSPNNKTVPNKYIRENYKSSNNKNVPNKYKGKTTNLTTKNYKSPNNKNVPNKYKGKTTNLPTKNYKSPNNETLQNKTNRC